MARHKEDLETKEIIADLLNKLEKYSEKHLQSIEALTLKREKLEKSIAEIDKVMSQSIFLLTPEGYQAEKKHRAEMQRELKATIKKLEKLDKGPVITQKEYSDLKQTLSCERVKLETDATIEIYNVLHELIEVVRKYNLPLSQLNAISLTIVRGLLKDNGPYTPAELPQHLQAVNNLLLSTYNELDSRFFYSKEPAELIDLEELKETTERLEKLATQIDYRSELEVALK